MKHILRLWRDPFTCPKQQTVYLMATPIPGYASLVATEPTLCDTNSINFVKSLTKFRWPNTVYNLKRELPRLVIWTNTSLIIRYLTTTHIFCYPSLKCSIVALTLSLDVSLDRNRNKCFRFLVLSMYLYVFTSYCIALNLQDKSNQIKSNQTCIHKTILPIPPPALSNCKKMVSPNSLEVSIIWRHVLNDDLHFTSRDQPFLPSCPFSM